jgi:hypothetical protein
VVSLRRGVAFPILGRDLASEIGSHRAASSETGDRLGSVRIKSIIAYAVSLGADWSR